MNSLSKVFELFFVLIMVTSSLSLIMIKPVIAQSTPIPSIPEFTLKYTDNSYVVPDRTVTTLDPYSGKQITTNIMGMYVQNKTIDIIISNQPFTPYNDSNGENVQLSYDVRWKGHFGTSWQFALLPYVLVNQDSSSQYTSIPLAFGGNIYGTGGIYGLGSNPEDGDHVDFQVEAYIGYFTQFNNQANQGFIGTTSGWSNTQTIIITESTTSPNPTPTQTAIPTISATPTPTVPEFPALTIPILLTIMLVAGLLVYFKKHKH